MFRNQSKFVDESNAIHQDLSQDKDYSIENIPVHTMAKDIQEIQNPSLKKNFYPEKIETAIRPQELTEKQKSSPFLNPGEKSTFVSEARPKSSPDYSQVNKAIQPNINAISEIKPSTGSNALVATIIILIALFVAAGTYYFITTRETSTKDSLSNTNEPTDIPSNKKEVEKSITATPTLNATRANYLTIDIASVDTAVIKQTLEKNGQAVMASGMKTPIEFIVVDKQNNPISFSNFAMMSGLTLSEKTLSTLEKDFSLFFLNDNGNIGLGLNLKTTNPDTLKTQLAQEESLLHKELAILLPYSDFVPPTNPFQTAIYKNQEIRYQNLISAKKLSIDYALQGNKIIIATTKLTIESILDKLTPQ